ncbi:MAG: hypothetical protein AB1898_11305 [Acidobacteriota bacterium]
MKRWLLILMLLTQGSPLFAQTFSVIHKKSLWWDGHGMIEITDEGIAYKSEDKDESRTWRYPDIQYFDRIDQKQFVLLTYQDQRLMLGRDRQYHFLITKGELSDSIFQTVSQRLGKPVTNRVVPDRLSSEYTILVKHLHTLGGCEGELKFTRDAIYYVTAQEEDGRQWLLDRDLQSVWSADRYQLEIYAYDNNRREFSRSRNYRFDLKEPLDPEIYRQLKLKMYQLEQVHLPLN